MEISHIIIIKYIIQYAFDNKYFDHVDFKDKKCLSEYNRALKDMAKNKLVYANFGINRKYNEEFEYLLKINKIEYEFLGENLKNITH